MDPSFSFEDGSDEELEFDKAEKTQSPWEFTAYSESVGEEHFRRNTTSIDAKISKAVLFLFLMPMLMMKVRVIVKSREKKILMRKRS